MKGLVPLLEALAKVRTERDDAHLVVVGRLRDDSRIPAVLDRLSLQGSVRFVSGISDLELAHLYGSAEVAVVPSLYEGFSLPAIEAMASGLPLIATTGGALPEVAGTDGETALLVPPDDAGALAAMVLRALSDESLRARIGAAGRLRTLERFTWPVTARLTAEQYRVLLEERRSPGAGDERAGGLPAGRRLRAAPEILHHRAGARC
jgi:glycosyltransferase involved in cell wall biosynthesis